MKKPLRLLQVIIPKDKSMADKRLSDLVNRIIVVLPEKNPCDTDVCRALKYNHFQQALDVKKLYGIKPDAIIFDANSPTCLSRVYSTSDAAAHNAGHELRAVRIYKVTPKKGSVENKKNTA